MDKLQVYHFNNGMGGGSFAVLQNLLQFSSGESIEHHIIYTINKDVTPKFVMLHTKGAKSENVFYYSAGWNFYYTCKQLAKLLPEKNILLIANDWLELGMVSTLGLQYKVIQIVHGDYAYYYDLAKMHCQAVDAYITVSRSIKEKLTALLTERKEDIHYLRFPVPHNKCGVIEKKERSVIFVGRGTEEKGYHLLPQVAHALVQKKINLQWHIVGEMAETQKYPWDPSINVVFHGQIAPGELRKLLCEMQVFILPSVAEGMPVSLVEAMKAGVIPVVNDLPGGIRELVQTGITGYLAKKNTTMEYVEILHSIFSNEIRNKAISDETSKVANTLFDPFVNEKYYANLFEKTGSRKPSLKRAVKLYGSRLDQSWIPNIITKASRRFTR